MPILKPISEVRALSDAAYEAIKEAILRHRMRPGEIYSEQRLAQELGISKTPVHESLIRLAHKGFVKLLPRRGVQVNQLSVDDIQNLYKLRAIIENAAVYDIATKLTERDFERFEEFRREELTYARTQDHVEYLRVDRSFHAYLANKTGNAFLAEALENIRDLVDWMGAKALLRRERIEEVVREHQAIVSALRKGDPDAAKATMDYHIRETLKNVLNQMELSEIPPAEREER